MGVIWTLEAVVYNIRCRGSGDEPSTGRKANTTKSQKAQPVKVLFAHSNLYVSSAHTFKLVSAHRL